MIKKIGYGLMLAVLTGGLLSCASKRGTEGFRSGESSTYSDSASSRGVTVVNSGHRVALVIGNADYKALSSLTNTLNDAQDMKAALEKVGFKVIYRENAGLSEMDEALHEFQRNLTPKSIGMVYYSGHGVQADGTNYLMPVRDQNITSKAELKERALSANLIVAAMEEAGNPVNILVLDACRNDPFKKGFRGTGSKGLASMSTNAKGMVIAFATAPDKLSSDGGNNDRNGLYTKYLKQYVTQPGLKIQDMFIKVREAVVNESSRENDMQIPWENSSLVGEVCLAGCGSSPSPAPQPVPQPVPVVIRPVVETRKSFEPEMVGIKAGCFQMGSPKTEKDRENDEKQHQVCVGKFEMSKYEVTQAQWQAVMGNNPSSFKGDNLPVENVSWNDVQSFVEKLNAKTGKTYRLPTEAEWEYAARAGTTTAYYTGKTITASQANVDYKIGKTTAVGSYPVNPWGLYDMAGNVYEWTCSDYVENYNGSESRCSNNGSGRVMRGGSGAATAGTRVPPSVAGAWLISVAAALASVLP